MWALFYLFCFYVCTLGIKLFLFPGVSGAALDAGKHCIACSLDRAAALLLLSEWKAVLYTGATAFLC